MRILKNRADWKQEVYLPRMAEMFEKVRLIYNGKKKVLVDSLRKKNDLQENHRSR